jgi:hypothetical protein
MSKTVTMTPRAKTKSQADSWVENRSSSDGGGKPKRLTLDLDPNVHRQLKLHCVKHDIEIAALLRKLIDRELRRNREEGA